MVTLRMLLAAAVLLAAAGCGASVDVELDVAAQAPTTATSTVTSAATITAAGATTAATAECPPGGGGQTDRGFFCPPDLPAFFQPGGMARVVHSALAGTYRTGVFTVPIEFTQQDRFQTEGERVDSVNLDNRCGLDPFVGTCWSATLYALGSTEIDLTEFASSDCIGAYELSDSLVGGNAATLLDIRSISPTCIAFVLEVPDLFGGFLMNSGERYLLYSVAAANGEDLLLVVAIIPAEDFDEYMAVAQPMIDSIRFLDN